MRYNVTDLSKLAKTINDVETLSYGGRVTQKIGLTVESQGPSVMLGEVCRIYSLEKDDEFVLSEVVGFRDNKVLLMPFSDLTGVGAGSRVVSTNHALRVRVGPELMGRLIDGLGNPLDGKGRIRANTFYDIENTPPPAITRARILDPLPLGVRAIDGLITCGRGQRVGIFAGSGVGKSTLLGMIARNAEADVNVITLVGERGREVREFIEKDLKAEGLEKSVVICATSDQPALIRIKAALLGTAVAEYFRDQGHNVMFMMDSVTRFAMAQREIGMAIGEPPVSRGYTPSVFAELPKLLERTGNSATGSITGLYTVLVDGDDLNEPISDAVRGILDGHIVLSRSLANRNHYPAIDVLASISRLMPDIASEAHYELANHLKSRMAVYRDAQDLINIGAYQKGSNPDIDEAIALNEKITKFLQQKVKEVSNYEQTLKSMAEIVK